MKFTNDLWSENARPAGRTRAGNGIEAGLMRAE